MVNIIDTFPSFVANGWWLYSMRAQLTIQCINQMIPALYSLTKYKNKKEVSSELKRELTKKYQDKGQYKRVLSDAFNRYGSDKATNHDYFSIYSELFENTEEVQKVFEIGLGTNNTDVVSTMGKNGSPGASLRAFRDFYPNASIYGADFDKRILFEEERIKTFFVDQTEPATFKDLDKKIPNDFDLMIDDGLHSPSANLHSLKFFLSKIRVGGYAIIEDICPNTREVWELVENILSDNFECAFIQMKSACIFVVRKLS